MSSYRKVKTRMWLDEKVRPLDIRTKLVFAYLMTTHHSHLSGVYFIHPQTIARELGLREGDVRGAFEELERVGRMVHDMDKEAVFVVNMYRHQTSEHGGGPKLARCAADQLENVGSPLLAAAFLAHYAHLDIPYSGPLMGYPMPLRYPTDRVSVSGAGTVTGAVGEGLPAPLPTAPVPAALPSTPAKRRTGARERLLEHHGQNAIRLFQGQEELRVDAVPGTRKRNATDERLTIIAERLDAGATVEECEHVLRVYAAEARAAVAKGERVWFDGETNWRPKNFERALGQPDPGSPRSEGGLSRKAEKDMKEMEERYGTQRNPHP